MKAPSKNSSQSEKIKFAYPLETSKQMKENYESRNNFYEEKVEESKPIISIVKRINVSAKKNTIFDSNGILLIGSHKIVKKKPLENIPRSNKISLPNNNNNNNNMETLNPNEQILPITKRIHK